MRKITFILVLLYTLPAMAANWYVHKGASGAGTGVDWTNAWTDMSSINFTSVACGDTIWIAGGNYTQTINATKVCTAGNVLSINRVLATDAVPVAAAGWSSGFDSTVNIAGPTCDLEGDYITISGRIAGGIVGTTTAGGGNSCIGAASRSISHDTLDHIKFAGPACAPAGNCTTAAYGVNIAPGTNTVTCLTVQYSELFNMSETFREANWQGDSGAATCTTLIQYNTIHDIFNDGIDHEDIIYDYAFGANGYVVWRYNTIYNSPNDGIFFEFGGATHFIFYRNVFWASGFSLITTKPPGTYGPILMYNNVFGSSTGPCSSNCAYVTDGGSTMTGVVLRNNVFFYVTNSLQGSAGEDSDYNAYSYTTLNGFGWPSSETHSLTYVPGTQNPFVNTATGNFHLNSGISVLSGKGQALTNVSGQTFNVDMDGNTAGASWDIGAFNPTSTPVPSRVRGGNTVRQ